MSLLVCRPSLSWHHRPSGTLSLSLVIHNCCAFGTADLQQRPPLGSAAGAAAGAEAGAEARAEAGAEAGAWIGREARHLPGKRRQSGKPPPSRRRNAAGPVRGSTELLAHQGVFPPILGVSSFYHIFFPLPKSKSKSRVLFFLCFPWDAGPWPCATSPYPATDRLEAKQLRMCLLSKRELRY